MRSQGHGLLWLLNNSYVVGLEGIYENSWVKRRASFVLQLSKLQALRFIAQFWQPGVSHVYGSDMYVFQHSSLALTRLQNYLILPHSGILWASWLHLGSLKLAMVEVIYITKKKWQMLHIGPIVMFRELIVKQLSSNSGFKFSTFYTNLHVPSQFLSLKSL